MFYFICGETFNIIICSLFLFPLRSYFLLEGFILYQCTKNLRTQDKSTAISGFQSIFWLDTIGPDIFGFWSGKNMDKFPGLLNGYYHYEKHNNYIVGIFSTVQICPNFRPEKIWMRIPRTAIQSLSVQCGAVRFLAGFWSGNLFTVHIRI